TREAAREIDVRVEVAQRQGAWRSENRLPTMQPRITGTCDGTPGAILAVHEDDVIERVHGLETQHEWRITMLFEYDGCEKPRFKAVRTPLVNDSSKAAQRRSPARFGVVRQPIEESLHGQRRSQPRDEAPLLIGKGTERRRFGRRINWRGQRGQDRRLPVRASI